MYNVQFGKCILFQHIFEEGTVTSALGKGKGKGKGTS
jgi:hypothetical protein